MIYGRLYTRSLGVHIGPEHVRAVELIRLGRWLVRGRSWCLPAADRLPAALGELAARVRRQTLRVATHLDPNHVRTAIREVAVEEIGRDDWTHRMTSGLLPEGVPGDAFRFTYRVLEADEDRVRVAVAVVARRALEARVEQLRESELEPTFVGVAELEAANAGAFDKVFRDRCRQLLIEQGGTYQLVGLREGVVESLGPVNQDDLASATEEGQERGSIWLAPCGASSTDLGAIPCVRPLKGLGRSGALEPEFTLATGLAIRGLYLQPDRDGEGSFLDPVVARSLHDGHEQRVGKRLTAALAAVTLAVLFAFTLADIFVAQRLARAEAALAPVAGLLATLEEQQARTERLDAEVRAAEERLGTRTHAAAALALTSALSPEGVRWRELDLMIGEGRTPRLILHGLAQADTSLAAFLRDLEAEALTSDVRLVVTETVASGAGASPSGPPLRRFEIHAEMPAVAGGADTALSDVADQ